MSNVRDLNRSGTWEVAVMHGPVGQQPAVFVADARTGRPLAAGMLEEGSTVTDFLVNAATGGARAIGPFMEMDLDGFQASFAKLWGYTNSVRIGGHFVKKDGAIALVSGYPARRFKPGYIAISSVGNAVEGFVRGMAKELAPVRINVVSPGFIDTPMFAQEGKEREDFLSQGTANHIIPRPGTAEEVAKGIMFVLDNSFVTGTTVDVDGGALLS